MTAGGKPLDGTWPKWLRENLDRKCNPEQLLGILLRNGFSQASIREHMGALFPAASALLREGGEEPAIDYAAIAKARITRPDSGLNAQRLVSDKLQLYTLDNFMSEGECKSIVKISGRHLRPSTVTTGDRDRGYRTSSTSGRAARCSLVGRGLCHR